MHIWIIFELRCLELRRATAVQYKMHMARCGTIGNHRDRQRGGMSRIVLDLDIEHRRQSAEPLCSDSQRVDLVVYFDS